MRNLVKDKKIIILLIRGSMFNKYYERQGFTKKEIIKRIAKDRNVSKNEIYMKFI